MIEPQAMAAPLHGIRIIAVEQFGAGPYATLYLADMDAEIIKIEDPGAGGDVGRYVPPGQSGTDSLFFETFNRDKRSLALDLKNPAGRRVLEQLATSSQAVFTNLRGDVPQQLGLTYETLGKHNPAIVCATLSAYGRTGERSSFPGYDALIQAEAGWAALTGEPDGPPVKSGLSLVDYSAGLAAALALMIALFDAQRTGRGRNVDVNLYDVAVALLTYPATWYLTSGVLTERVPFSAHPSIVPFQFFETSDGHLAIACAKEKFFKSLARALGMPELLDDPRFASFEARRQSRSALTGILNDRFKQRTTAEWMQALRGQVPVAPVRSLARALDQEELAARQMLISYPHDSFDEVRTVGTPFTLDGFAPNYRRAPALDADRSEVLATAGFKHDEIEALAQAGAFGS
jgi:crotonobetainyl-CoA:carnitine CoA-transferase CaiB-like acyl-CoA transferase